MAEEVVMAGTRTTRVLIAASVAAASGMPMSAFALRPEEPVPGAGVKSGQLNSLWSVVQPEVPPPAPTEPAPAPAPDAQPQTPPVTQPPTSGGEPAPVVPPPAAPATPPSATPQSGAPEAAAAAAPAAAKGISFNFKDTPLDQVLDFFARESGLPVIFEAAVPTGGMTFVSGREYSFDEALSILNLNLYMRGVALRKHDKFLYFGTLQDSAKRATAVAKGEVPATMTPDELLTLTIPLSNARADLVAEQMKALIGAYGLVQSVPAQNMVIVLETAAQCRRIAEIVRSIDNVKPVDAAFRLFPLKFAQAPQVLNALRGLMGEKRQTVVIGKDNQRQVIEDTQVQGLNLTADERLNSIIAVGPEARIKTVEELVLLLDRPDGAGTSGEAQMVTFVLRSMAADAAAAKLGELFASVPANRKPTILPMKEVGKVTVVGPSGLIVQASTLLGELDPGTSANPAATGAGAGAASGGGAVIEDRAAVIRLKHATAASMDAIMPRLLSPRQQAMLKFAPGPDGKSMVVRGSDEDVKSFEAIIAGLDAPAQSDKQVRVSRITQGDPASVLARAVSLYQSTGENEKDPVNASLEGASRSVTMIGSAAGLVKFEQLLAGAQGAAAPVLTARTFVVEKTRPSALVPKLQRLARAMLAPSDGGTFAEPSFDAVDDLKTIVVRGEAGQFAAIEELIKRLDGEDARQRDLRIVKLSGADPAGMLARVRTLYIEKAKDVPAGEAGEVAATLDEASGTVLLSGTPGGVRMFADLVTQAQQLSPPARTTRVIDVQQSKASAVVEPLMALLKGADSIDAARKVPEPTVSVLERTNSLVVTAEPAQFGLIEEFVRRLDKPEPGVQPPMKLLQLRTANAEQIAGMLQQQYGQRAMAERAEKPVDVRADSATNTLIVSAHEELFGQIREFVEELNKEKKQGRETKLFPLKVAKAVDVAAAMDKLYPQPPMPVDRLGRPMPWAQQPKEVIVSAEANSNSLIIDGPTERMESLTELAAKLDRVELPPAAELRTFRVAGAGLSPIATTLQGLARQGHLSAPASAGKPQVQVLVETEPKSSTLIVAGDELTFSRVEQMLKDLSAVPIEKGLRVIPVANARAAELRERAMKVYEAQVSQIPGANPVEVAVDETTNSLSVVADGEAMARFVKVVEELQRQVGPAREVRMIELRHAKPAEVVEFIRDLVKSSKSMQLNAGPEPVIEPIEATNSLLVAAQAGQFAVIESLVRNLDAARDTERPPIRILRVRTSDAANLAQVLQASYSQRPAEMKRKQPVDIQADPATNTLVVSAHADVLPEIEAIVEQLNETQAVDAAGREIRIFPLKVARAEELAQTIDQMFPEPPMPLDPRTRQPRPDLRPAREVVVRADRATNALIVDAPAKRLAGFEQIVKSLDQQKLAGSVELRTYRVQRADVNAVASSLRNLASGGALGPASLGLGQVTIEPQVNTRTLVVSGPAEIFAGVEKLLKELDAAPDRPGTTLKTYPLKSARAERIVPLLQKLLATRVREQAEAEGKGVGAEQTLLEVAGDNASNTLIISAPEGVQTIAEELIRTLDTQAAATGKSVIRVVPLNFADAAMVAAAVSSALAGVDLPSGGTVTVTPAPGSGALLLTGMEADLAKAEELVKPLDTRPTGADQPAIETFELAHADARAMAQIVERLLVQQQETDPRIIQLRLQLARQNRQDLFKQQSIKVEAAPQANALIVSAPSSTLELAREVIKRLDVPAGQTQRIVGTFTPTPGRGDAAQLAATVTRVVNATVPQGRGPVEISVEPRSGVIVAIGSQEQVAASLKAMAEFDDRAVGVPQVELQVVELKSADAASVAPMVQSLLADKSRWPVELLAAERAGISFAQPRVNAEPRGNRVMISTPSVLMALAKELIATLDQEPAGGRADVRVFRLEKGEAASVAQALTAGMSASLKPGEAPATATAEPSSNTVVVAGSAAQLEVAAKLVEGMDAKVEPAGLGVRTMYLKHARAEVVAPVVETVLQRESPLDRLPFWMRGEVLSRQGAKADPPQVKVAAETRLNAIVVSGPTAVLDAAEQMIAELDADPSERGIDTARAVRIITLKNAEAQALAASLEAVFKDEAAEGGPPPTIRVDAASNSLIVRATSGQMEMIEELAGELDQATLAGSRQMRLIPLDPSRADAELMARALKRLLEQQGSVKVKVISTQELLKQQGGEKDSEGDDGPKDGGGAGGSGAGKKRTSAEGHGGYDVPARSGLAGLHGALAMVVSSSAFATMPPEAMVGAHAMVAVQATREKQAAAKAEWDRLIAEARAAILVAENAEKKANAENAERDAEKARSRGAGDATQARAGADGEVAAKAVGVLGLAPEALKDQNAEALKDQKAEALTDSKAVAPAVSAMQALRERMKSRRVQPVGLPDESDGEVTIAVDPASNSLVVLGSPRVTDRLVALAAQLEKNLPAEPTEVRVVTLPEGMDAQPIVQIVNQTIQQLGRKGPNNPGGFSGPVSIASDPTGSAVIVLANETDFETIGQLVGAVSQLSASRSLTVKVYPLASIPASRAQAAVRDLLSAAPAGAQARRLRELDLTVQAPDGTATSGTFEPASVRVVADAAGASLIVAAPGEAIPLLDSFIALIDQSPVQDRLSIRRYELKNARAEELSGTLQALFEAQRQGPAASELPQARFVADERGNALLVTASEPQHADVTRLLKTADAALDESGMELALITLKQASPGVVQRIIEEVVIGRDEGRKERIRFSASEGSNLLVVRAAADDLKQVREIVEQVDQAETGGLPVRTVKLERADAQTVAGALTRLFNERAQVSSRPGQRVTNRVAVIGDRRSGTLVVAAGDEDYEQVKSLAADFDKPTPRADLQYRLIALKNAKARDVLDSLQNIQGELQWERMSALRGGIDQGNAERIFFEANERSNTLLVFGQGEMLDLFGKIIADFDQPDSKVTSKIVKVVPIEKGDLQAIKTVIERAMAGQEMPDWWYWPPRTDQDKVTVEIDRVRRLLIFVGPGERVEKAAAYAAELDAAGGREGQKIEAIALKHARADRAAANLRNFFAARSRAQGTGDESVSISGSADGNVIIVSADEKSLAEIKDLVARIDQPEVDADREINIYAVRNASLQELTTTLRSMFPQQRGDKEQVIITPQPSISSLIVSSPKEMTGEIEGLLAQLDRAPTAEETNVATLSLTTARATEVAAALRGALPPNVKVTLTPIARTNTLLLTGSDEAIALVREQVKKIDSEPARSLVVFKRFKLNNAESQDVAFTLGQMLRARPSTPGEPAPTIDWLRGDNTLMVSAPGDQMADIEKMVAELDVASDSPRRTDFVKLQFAKAQPISDALGKFFGRFAPEAATPAARNVTIYPDPASNSLVISAEESQWEAIRALLKKLDQEEYDTSLQLTLIPLKHAEAASVARALNEGFRGPLNDQIRREQARERRRNPGQGGGARDDRDDIDEGGVLVAAEGLPTVTSEPQTNSLIVFSGRQELEKIRSLVKQLDVPDILQLPAAQIVPLKAGKPSEIASKIRELFVSSPQSGGQRSGGGGPRSVLILGDDTSGCLIVRADEEQFAQIKALAETLQQQGLSARVQPQIVKLVSTPAARLRQTLLATFTPMAQQMGETLAIEVDRSNNALVVMASPRVFEEISKVVKELDAAAPEGKEGEVAGGGTRLGQSVFIIDVKNNAPADVQKMLEEMGLTRPQPADRPGVVSEPVTIVPMTSRRAIAVLASAGDGPAVVELVRALDAEPANAEQSTAFISLKTASANAVVNVVRQMLNAAQQDVKSGPGAALAEHVRRLNLVRTGLDQNELKIDLTQPVRLIPDQESNAVVVASTPTNVAAVREVIRTLDVLPIGDAVVVRIFPLENASSVRIQSVIKQLFSEGEALRRLPGTQRRGLPTTQTGQALAGEISVAIDERTNALIVAGREEAVAFVEVLLKDLDSDEVANWIEPAILPLKFADANTLARKLTEILIRGLSTSPEALGLQRVYGRLRMAQAGKDPKDPNSMIEADLFAPQTGLVISAEPDLNAIIVVGTPANVAIVKELIATLDVEGASAANAVRVFPLRFAAADRVSQMARTVFQQREQMGALREEDRLVIVPDARTNSLVVSTSPKSFAILEGLLKTLDGERANFSVGLHVIPVANSDVRQLAPKVERLMKERLDAQTRVGEVTNPQDVFSVEAEPINNMLIVACSDENLALVKELVAALTAEGGAIAGGAAQELIQLKRTPASEAARAIEELYVEREVQKRGQGSVSVTPNDRLNAVVVTGTAEDVAAIRKIVERMESAEALVVREIERIELKSANALEVVNLLEQVLGGTPVSGTRGIGTRQITKLRFLRERIVGEIAEKTGREPKEAEVDGIVKEHVTLTPDLRSNSVMIAAPKEVVALVREIMEDLDSTAAGSRKIEKFQLKNADARQMARLLQGVFRLEQQGEILVLVPNRLPQEGEPGGDQGPAGTTVTAVPDARQQLSIAIDARTNMLIVSGTEEYIELVRKIVNEIDDIEANEREQTVYHLRNAKAKDIETTLKSYFSGESVLQRSTLGNDQIGALARQLEQEVTLVGDEKSNKLVISTSPRYMETVLKIVEELDAAPPQVMIQVLLAEVTIDSGVSFGADLRVGPFGTKNFQGRSLGGNSGVETSLGVPNLSVSSADFQLLIRALEAQGKLEVLSEPKLMVNNNTRASIQVGQDIAIVDGVERTPQGGVVSDVQRRDVGIILEVTPTISSDGFVRMEIRPEISTVSAQTTQLGQGVEAPSINKRTVDTVVTVRDGQSVVIGGLIQTTDEKRRTKVPILGDFPLLGGLFRSVKTASAKTELLVILTPHVVMGQGPYREERSDVWTEQSIRQLADPTQIREYLERAKMPPATVPPETMEPTQRPPDVPEGAEGGELRRMDRPAPAEPDSAPVQPAIAPPPPLPPVEEPQLPPLPPKR
jgi:type II secretion system protein D